MTILKSVPLCKEPNFTQALVNIQTPLGMSDKMARQTSDLEKLQINLLDFHYWLRMHFVYKERWNSKHKIPVRLTKEVREAYTLEGKHIATVVELCIQCHAQYSTPYGNGAEWFAKIELEAKNLELELILSIAEAKEKQVKNKQVMVDRNRRAFKYLDDYKNPVEPKKQPHLYRLIEVARKIAEANDKWCNKYWIPYKRTYRALLQDIERNSVWQQIYGKDGEVYVSVKGGGTKMLGCKNPTLETFAL